MTTRASSIVSGLAWIVFSPIVLLMAPISTVDSDITYYVQVALFGVWSTCGVATGIGRLTNATWANRLQIVLAWIGLTYFAVCLVLIGLYLIADMFEAKNERDWNWAFFVAVGVCMIAVPFYFLARKGMQSISSWRKARRPQKRTPNPSFHRTLPDEAAQRW